MTQVSEIMSRKVVTIQGSKLAFDAASLMSKQSVGSVVVVSDSQVVGILTERDIVSKVVADSFDPKRVLVEDIMTRPVIVIQSTANAQEAASLMKQFRIRRLPVVDSTGLVGIVTATDLAKTIPKNTDPNSVNEVVAAISRNQPPDTSSPYQ